MVRTVSTRMICTRDSDVVGYRIVRNIRPVCHDGIEKFVGDVTVGGAVRHVVAMLITYRHWVLID